MKTNFIPLKQWIKKSGFSERKVRRLIKEGIIPTKMIPMYIVGIKEDFKLKEKK
jgi:hypothetical protein